MLQPPIVAPLAETIGAFSYMFASRCCAAKPGSSDGANLWPLTVVVHRRPAKFWGLVAP